MQSEGPKQGLYAGTSLSDLAYHACYGGREARQKDGMGRSRRKVALCGLKVLITPLPWDEARQSRQDSCIACVRRVQKLLDAAAKQRALAGPLVAGYIRASTDRQAESPDVQERIIRDYCTKRALKEPAIYVDQAVSGKVELCDRPAGRRLIADLRRGDQVVVARIDRLSRNFLDFARTIDLWSKMGVTLHPCDFPMTIVPDDPLCSAFVHILSIFSTYERRLIAQRTREAKAHIRTLGRKLSWKPHFGFKFEKRADGHEYEVRDEAEAVVAEKCFDLALEGYSNKQIADYLNVEWGITNPRTMREYGGNSGRGRPSTGNPANIGRFRMGNVPNMIVAGFKLRKLAGTLPPGIESLEDLQS